MAVRSSSQRMGPWLLLVKAYQGSRRCSAFPRKQGHSLAWDYGAVCAAAGRCTVDCCLSTTTPEQIALSLTRDSSEMRVAWVMAPAAPRQEIQWGPTASASTFSATSSNRMYTRQSSSTYLPTKDEISTSIVGMASLMTL
jgi:hypothetical protein